MHLKIYALNRGGWFVYLISRHAQKLLWKHIYWINPLTRTKKRMWLCLNRACDWITGLTQHLKYWFGGSEMPEPKSVIRMIQFSPSLTRLRSQTPASKSKITWQCLLCFICRSEAQVIYDVRKKSHSGFHYCSDLQFYYKYFVPISQELVFFCSLEHMGLKQFFICKCSMWYSNFDPNFGWKQL